jgi:hypothetical protein
MIAAMDLAAVFFSSADKGALRGASHATANETRSLAERLMAMTLRANEEQRVGAGRLRAMTLRAIELSTDVSIMEIRCDEWRDDVRDLRLRAERRNGTVAAQNGQLAGLLRRVRDLRVCLETGEFPDDDPDAFFAIDDGQ